MQLSGRAPDVLGSRTLWSGLTKRKFNGVALAEHLNPIAVDGALVKKILLAPGVRDESEPLLRAQRLNRTCHSFASAVWALCGRCRWLRRPTAMPTTPPWTTLQFTPSVS